MTPAPALSLYGPIADRSVLEVRRQCATELLKSGMSQAKVARRFGVSRTTTSRWGNAIKAGKSLLASRGAGRPSKLSAEQLADLAGFVREYPHLTSYDVAAHIEHAYGVVYHHDHAGRLRAKLLEAR